MKKESFHATFSKLLQQNLCKFTNPDTTAKRTLDRATCIAIYQTIYETVISVLEGSEIVITNEAVNYVAQQYYAGVLINGRQELDPNIFDRLASLDNVPNKDLLVMVAMLNGTDFVKPVAHALKNRN